MKPDLQQPSLQEVQWQFSRRLPLERRKPPHMSITCASTQRLLKISTADEKSSYNTRDLVYGERRRQYDMASHQVQKSAN